MEKIGQRFPKMDPHFMDGVYVTENPDLKWMMTGGTRILRNSVGAPNLGYFFDIFLGVPKKYLK